MEISRIIVATIIISVTAIGGYYVFKLGYTNYKELMPFVCGVFMIMGFLRIMLCVIHFINGLMGWKSILFN